MLPEAVLNHRGTALESPGDQAAGACFISACIREKTATGLARPGRCSRVGRQFLLADSICEQLAHCRNSDDFFALQQSRENFYILRSTQNPQ